MSRKFGWHSGTVHAQDGKFRGDLYIQDDIVFSDVSAGVLGVTGGIDMTGTTSAIGIDMGGTFSTTAINIDGTCGSAINITISDDLSVSATYNKAIYSVQTLTGEDAADGGGLQGIRSDTNNSTYDNSWQVSMQGRATATGAATVGDTIGVYAAVKTVGALTALSGDTSLVAFKGDVSDSPGSSFDANVHGVMIGYASQINYGGKTSLFFGYTHATAYCDYGLLIDNYSPNMTAGIYLTQTTGATPNMTYGISIDSDCTTHVYIAPSVAAGSFKGLHINPTLTGTQVASCAIDIDMNYSGGDINFYITDFDATQTGITSAALYSRGNMTGIRCDVNAIGNIDHVWSARIGSTMAMAANTETNQFYGGLISAAASGAFTLTLHDGLVGAQIAVSVDSGVTDVTGGIITALFTNCSSVAKDTTSPIYGIFNKIGQYCDAAININTSTGHCDGSGILFDTDTQSCSLDSAMKFSNSSAAVTNLLDIGTANNAPHSVLKCANSASDSAIVIEVAGSTKYIPVFDSAS